MLSIFIAAVCHMIAIKVFCINKTLKEETALIPPEKPRSEALLQAPYIDFLFYYSHYYQFLFILFLFCITWAFFPPVSFLSPLSWDWRLWGEPVPVTPPQQQLHPRSNAPHWQNHGVSLKEYVSRDLDSRLHSGFKIRQLFGSSRSFCLTLFIRSLKAWLRSNYSLNPSTGNVVSDRVHVPLGTFIIEVAHSGKQPLNERLLSQRAVYFYYTRA